MEFLKNVNVAKKLSIGFFILVAFVVTAGGVGLYSIENVSKSTSIIANEEAPIVAAAARMQLMLMTGRNAMEEFMSSTATIGTSNGSKLGKIISVFKKSLVDFDESVDAIIKGKTLNDGTVMGRTDNQELADLVREADRVHNEQFQVASTKMMRAGRKLLELDGVLKKSMKDMEAVYDKSFLSSENIKKLISKRIQKLSSAAQSRSAALVIVKEEVPIADMANELRTALAQSRIVLEEVVQFRDLETVADAEERFKKEVANFDKYVGAILNGADLGGVIIIATKDSALRTAVKDMDEKHETFQQTAWTLIEAQKATLRQIKLLNEAMDNLDSSGDLAEKIIAKVALLSGREMTAAKLAADDLRSWSFTILGTVILIAVFFGIIIAFMISRSITGPINQTVGMLEGLEQGDLTNRLKLNRKDEIGLMANAMDNFAENLEALVDNIRNSSGEVSGSSTSLTDIANVLAAGSEENAVQANNVSTAAEQLSSNVNTVATAVEEMSSTIKEITGTVAKSSETTEKAVQRSNKASEVIRALSESSEAIGRITDLISSIAAQTNILALNATIEAARAGDAGKGFAVVANEVKELATETSKATDEIVSQISGMQTNARDAVTAMDEIGSVLTEVHTYAATISAAIEEQSSTTAEIARSMNEAATGVKDIVSNVTGVADSAGEISKKSTETKAAADSLSGVSTGLAKLVATFKTSNSESKGFGSSGSSGGNSEFSGLGVRSDPSAREDREDHLPSGVTDSGNPDMEAAARSNG